MAKSHWQRMTFSLDDMVSSSLTRIYSKDCKDRKRTRIFSRSLIQRHWLFSSSSSFSMQSMGGETNERWCILLRVNIAMMMWGWKWDENNDQQTWMLQVAWDIQRSTWHDSKPGQIEVTDTLDSHALFAFLRYVREDEKEGEREREGEMLVPLSLPPSLSHPFLTLNPRQLTDAAPAKERELRVDRAKKGTTENSWANPLRRRDTQSEKERKSQGWQEYYSVSTESKLRNQSERWWGREMGEREERGKSKGTKVVHLKGRVKEERENKIRFWLPFSSSQEVYGREGRKKRGRGGGGKVKVKFMTKGYEHSFSHGVLLSHRESKKCDSVLHIPEKFQGREAFISCVWERRRKEESLV